MGDHASKQWAMLSDSNSLKHFPGYVRKNNLVGTIENWGPLFRISFDLIFNSKPTSEQNYNILAFKENGGTNDCCKIGDRVPYLSYHPSETTERLTFASAVGANGNWTYDHNLTVEINKKYNFVVEQKIENNKVCNFMSICVRRRQTYYILQVYFSASIDGTQIFSELNPTPRSFQDVQVFMGDDFTEPADASYSNLVWVNTGMVIPNH